MMLPLLAPATNNPRRKKPIVAASYPLNDALVMQNTPPRQRGIAVGLTSIAWSLGWAVASAASGWIQVRWGFGPPLLCAMATYILSAFAILAFGRPR
jgi:MFS family permease